MTPASAPARWRHGAMVALRTVAAIAGGWGVMALAVPLAAIAFTASGWVRSEATVLAMMLGFVGYLVLLLWAFSVRSVVRLLVLLSSAAALCAALLHFLR